MSREFAYAVIDVTVGAHEHVDEVIDVMREVALELRADPFWGEIVLSDLDVAGVQKWVESALVLRSRLMTQPMKQTDVRREYLRRLKMALESRHQDQSMPAVGLQTPQLSHSSTGG